MKLLLIIILCIIFSLLMMKYEQTLNKNYKTNLRQLYIADWTYCVSRSKQTAGEQTIAWCMQRKGW